MPHRGRGVPLAPLRWLYFVLGCAFFAIGVAGATNAALTAAAILALQDPKLDAALKDFRRRQTEAVLEHPDPRVAP